MKYVIEMLGQGYVLVNKHYKTSLNSFVQALIDADRTVNHHTKFKGYKGE